MQRRPSVWCALRVAYNCSYPSWRARDQTHAECLLAQGATQIVHEVREASLEMGRMMLEHSGLPADARAI